MDPEGRGERNSRTESEQGIANAVWKSQGWTESRRSMFRLVEGKRDSRKESGHKSKARQNRRKCPSPFTKQTKMIRHNQSPWSSPSKTGQEGSQDRETAPRDSLTGRSVQGEACQGVPTDHEARRRKTVARNDSALKDITQEKDDIAEKSR